MAGNILWNRTYSGQSNSLIQTGDGGYALAGVIMEDVPESQGSDFWLCKTDSNGNQLWSKTYWKSHELLNSEEAHSVIQTSDGGYVIGGDSGTYRYDSDYWLVRTDSLGNQLWSRTYGINTNLDLASSLVQCSDGGYAIAGATAFITDSPTQYDFWLVKIPADAPPYTINDYDGLWHTTGFTIKLSATDDFSGVYDTYYKINDGTTRSVSVNGQPVISADGASNKLEYWSVDSLGHEELPHQTLTGIRLDKTAPSGTIIINNGDAYTTSTSVTLSLTYADASSGVYQVRYSNDGVLWQLH